MAEVIWFVWYQIFMFQSPTNTQFLQKLNSSFCKPTDWLKKKHNSNYYCMSVIRLTNLQSYWCLSYWQLIEFFLFCISYLSGVQVPSSMKHKQVLIQTVAFRWFLGDQCKTQLIKIRNFFCLFSASQHHPLFHHGICQWPGCEAFCENFQQFMQ